MLADCLNPPSALVRIPRPEAGLQTVLLRPPPLGVAVGLRQTTPGRAALGNAQARALPMLHALPGSSQALVFSLRPCDRSIPEVMPREPRPWRGGTPARCSKANQKHSTTAGSRRVVPPPLPSRRGWDRPSSRTSTSPACPSPLAPFSDSHPTAPQRPPHCLPLAPPGPRGRRYGPGRNRVPRSFTATCDAFETSPVWAESQAGNTPPSDSCESNPGDRPPRGKTDQGGQSP